MAIDLIGEPQSSTRAVDDDPLQVQELRDEADEFEDELAAEMLRKGVIEVWT